LEAVGFAIKDKGWKLAEDGSIGLKGKIPGGASGVYQAVEAVTQLRGQAGAKQIAGAKTALIQSLGGPASTAVSHILQTV